MDKAMMDNNNENTLYTSFIKDEIGRCESSDDLKKYIMPLLKTQQEQWALRIQRIVEESGYTKSKFAELCGVSRVTLDKWCKGSIPRNRETFLIIGLIANYNIEEMNRFLERYGRYPGLYSKSLDDCICIFVINNYLGTDKLEKYNYILKKIKEKILIEEEAGTEKFGTQFFNEKLSDVKTEEELEKFIEENIKVFTTAYHEFYAQVKTFIDVNLEIDNGSISVAEMAKAQRWSSSLRQCVSAIRQKKWFPTRNKIISLGLHLSMVLDEIDDLLEAAHMEPLCAKNPFESIIMYVLINAELNETIVPEEDSLCKDAKEALSEFEFEEAELFLSELLGVENE